MATPKKEATSFRLTPEAKRLLGLIAEKFGLSQGAALELAIRKFAKQEKLP